MIMIIKERNGRNRVVGEMWGKEKKNKSVETCEEQRHGNGNGLNRE